MAKNANTTQSATPVFLTVSQIVHQYDLSSIYVKRALQKGWLHGEKRLMPNSKVEQWIVDQVEVEAWRKRATSSRSTNAGFTGSAKQMRELQEFAASAKAEDLAALIASLTAAKG